MTNQVTTILLLGVLSAVLVAFGGMLGPGYLYFFTGLAVLVNLGAHLFSDRIVLAMHQAREVAPEDAPRLHAGRFGPPRTAPGASLVVSVTD